MRYTGKEMHLFWLDRHTRLRLSRKEAASAVAAAGEPVAGLDAGLAADTRHTAHTGLVVVAAVVAVVVRIRQQQGQLQG